MDDGYTVTYTYTNDDGTNTGGTPEITWFISDNPDGSDSTQVSMEQTYTPTDINRYKHLAATVRIRAAEGGYTAAVISAPVFPGFAKQASGTTGRFTPNRGSHTSVVFMDRMWVIGGFDGNQLNDVWSSTDGSTWTQVRTDGAMNGFSARSSHTSVVFMDSIRVIGGFINQVGRVNDVWSSADGSNWTQATANTEFTARSNHTSVVFDNRMWVIGGFTGNNSLNDVWSSADGTTWTPVRANGAANGFPALNPHTSVVFDNRMWVIGGLDGNRLNDVWSSADGSTWTQATPAGDMNGFTARSFHTSVVFDNSMWVIGGLDEMRNPLNDVWSSADGNTWTQAIPEAGFPGRFSHTSVVFDDRMWVIGGTSGAAGRVNDVWY